ncbi:MAG: class I SAM-dependent methyltransferase [Pseudomonadota bacterium]
MPWVMRWADLIPARGRVLDVACGTGRHATFLAGRGHPVDAVDRDLSRLGDARNVPGVRWWAADLEAAPWPFDPAAYQAVVVTNYLHRPLFPYLLAALAPGGVLIYATFALGQARWGRPRDPRHLLVPGELLELARGRLQVVAYEDILEAGMPPSRVQRLCALMQ